MTNPLLTIPLLCVARALAWQAGPMPARPTPRALLDSALSQFAPLPAPFQQLDERSDRLFEMIAGAWLQNDQVDDARASELVDSILSENSAFSPELLGGGLWLSLYMRGPTPRWATNARFFQGLGGRNRVGQNYDPTSCSVQNLGEILGNALYVTAQGSFALRDDPSRGSCPVVVDVAIDNVMLVAFGLTINLGVKGRLLDFARLLKNVYRTWSTSCSLR